MRCVADRACVDVRAIALDVDEIGWAVPADLVSERYVAVPAEPSLRAIHAHIVVQWLARRNRGQLPASGLKTIAGGEAPIKP